jgi:hypothetical protein
MLIARAAFLNEVLAERRDFLDNEVVRFTALRADPCVPHKKIARLIDEGRQKEIEFNRVWKLVRALDIVDMIADQIKNEWSWDQCACKRCKYFASEKWLQEQPFDLAPEALPPRRFHTTYPDEEGWGQTAESDEGSNYSCDDSDDDDSDDDDSDDEDSDDGETLQTPRRGDKIDSPITGANSDFDECSQRQAQWLNDIVAAGSPSRVDPSRVLFYSQDTDQSDYIDAIAGV